MNKWLLAAIVSSIVVPPAAMLVAGSWGLEPARERARGALSDLLVDDPGRESLAPDASALRRRAETIGGVDRTNELLAQPVLIEAGRKRRVVRLLGLDPTPWRLDRLRPLVEAGEVDPIGDEQRLAIALGAGAAEALGVRPGREVRLLGLSFGGQALGFRRRSAKVTAVLRSGLDRFDGTAGVGHIELARALHGAKSGVNGLEAWFAWPPPPNETRRRLAAADLGDLRARPWSELDHPREDRVADLALARSFLFVALVVALLAVPLCGLGPARPYHRYLERVAPVSGISLILSLLAASLTAWLAVEVSAPFPWDVRTDLGRLFLAVSIGLLIAPILLGHLRGTLAAAALAILIAIVSIEPAANAVMASASARTAERLGNATRSLATLASSGPVVAAAWRGAEVVPLELAGLDPAEPRAAKLLRVLTEGREVRLRPEGAQRPRPWSAGGEPFDELLDRLATSGSAIEGAGAAPEVEPEHGAEAGADRADPGEPAPLVLGALAAERLGVEAGDLVRLTAAPAEVAPDGTVDPPQPVTFRVAALSRLGLRSVDERLALADTWQVEALGGETGGEARERLVSLAEVTSGRAFGERARRASMAALLQAALVAFFLGGAVASGWRERRRPGALLLWLAAGLGAGLMMGYGEAVSGMVQIGDETIYQALPRGRGQLGDLLSPWAAIPGLAAAALGVVGFFRRRKRG